MARIGSFKKDADGKLQGEIKTLTFYTKATILQVEGRSDSSPSLRVYAGLAKIGVGWDKTSPDGKHYASVKLDDPSLAAPINAALFENDEKPGTYDLIWSRNKPE